MAICKRICSVLMIVIPLFSSPLFGQGNVFNITQGNIQTCSGDFVDSGGRFGNYGPNERDTVVICPSEPGNYIRLTFTSGIAIDPNDRLIIYDTTYINPNLELVTSEEMENLSNPFIAQATAVNPSGCLTLLFISDGTDEGEGWNAEIQCTQRCQKIEAVIVNSDPIINPPDTGYMDICPGEMVQLSGQGLYSQNNLFYQQSDLTSSFLWNFGDGTEAVGPNVTHVYDDPGGYIVQLTITDNQGCRNYNFLSQRVRVAPYPSFETFTDFADQSCSNDTISLKATLNASEGGNVIAYPGETGFLAGGVLSDSLALPDGTGVVYETSILLTDFSPGQRLENVNDLLNVFVNMEHSWLFDIDVFLRCPDGTQIILQKQEFQVNEVHLGEPVDGDENIPNSVGVGYDYFWTPNATQTWTQYINQFDPETLPTGNYKPFQPFSNLQGCPLNGEWTIIVQDLWAVDNGWIFEWGINFNPTIYPKLEKFTVPIVDLSWEQNPSYLFNSADSLADILPFAGSESYTLNVTDAFGCVTDTTINVVVLPQNHPDCRDCQEIIQEAADVLLCDPQAVSFDVNANLPTQETLVFSSSPNHPLGAANSPPSNPYLGYLSVNGVRPVTLTSPFTQITSICIDIETDWDDDLEIFLIAPSGEVLELSTNNGGGGQNYTNTCFSSSAPISITAGTPPFTGSFQPEGSWSDLQGATINGNWAIQVSDAFGPLQVGRLNSWSITFVSNNEVSYSWTPSTGLSCTNCPNPTANPGVSTNYILSASDDYGCTAVDTISVVFLDDITAPIVSCDVTDLGQITYTWSQVNDFDDYEVNVVINGVEGGWGPITGLTYQVEGLDLNDEVQLKVRVAPGGASINCEAPEGSSNCVYDACFLTILAENVKDVSCDGYADGQVQIGIDKGIAPYNYFIDNANGQASNFFGQLSVGAHTVIVEDAQLCRDTITFTINNAPAFSVSLSIDETINCFEEENGAISATVTGGRGNIAYFWNASATADNASLSNLPADEYSVQAIDTAGCIATDTIQLVQPEAIQIDLDVSQISCSGDNDGAITAVVSGGTGNYNYQWNNNSNNNTISNLAAGNFCVTVTDASGCEQSACIDLTAPVAIFVDTSFSTPVSCFGGSNGTATLIASGGTGTLSYAWNDSLSQISSQAVFLRAGIYQTIISDEAGCSITANVEVQQPSALTVTTKVTDALCFDGKDGTALAEPLGGTGPYMYSWETGATGAMNTGLQAGAYVVTVMDNNGCETEALATIGQPSVPISTNVVQTFEGCFGAAANAAMVTASGGSNPVFSFAWSDPMQQTTATATNLDSTVHFVTVTDGNGCIAKDTLKLKDLPPIELLIIANSPSCSGFSDGEMGINQIMGGAGQGIISNYSIKWSNNSNNLAIQGLTGNRDYQVTVTDNQGCTGVSSRFLEDPISITFDAQIQNTSCFNATDGSASVVNIQGDGAAFNIRWDNNTGNQIGSTATALRAGSYGVTVTNEEGCFGTDIFSVGQPPRIEVAYQTKDNECYGDQIGKIQATVSGGTPGYTYLWSNNATAPSLQNLLAGSYTLTVTDQNGCESISTAAVVQPNPIELDLKGINVTCYGGRDGSIDISVSGGTAPFQYSLDNKNFTGSSRLIGLEQGAYNIFIKDAFGCFTSSQAEVGSPLEFKIDPGSDLTIVLGDTISLNAFPVNPAGSLKEVEYIWDAPYEGTLSCNECISPMAFPINTITYDVLGIDENGCEATSRITVFVEKPRLALVPTGFTPNNDNNNDLLQVHGMDKTFVKVFQVFDRWGELLYEQRDFEVNQSLGWDGTFRNEPMASGVYIWYMEVVYPYDDAEETLWGQTTLIR
ncbi:MAG: proprotein convertase P-domain-containing protein [Saprospiraceae bacterium]